MSKKAEAPGLELFCDAHEDGDETIKAGNLAGYQDGVDAAVGLTTTAQSAEWHQGADVVVCDTGSGFLKAGTARFDGPEVGAGETHFHWVRLLINEGI